MRNETCSLGRDPIESTEPSPSHTDTHTHVERQAGMTSADYHSGRNSINSIANGSRRGIAHRVFFSLRFDSIRFDSILCGERRRLEGSGAGTSLSRKARRAPPNRSEEPFGRKTRSYFTRIAFKRRVRALKPINTQSNLFDPT